MIEVYRIRRLDNPHIYLRNIPFQDYTQPKAHSTKILYGIYRSLINSVYTSSNWPDFTIYIFSDLLS